MIQQNSSILINSATEKGKSKLGLLKFCLWLFTSYKVVEIREIAVGYHRSSSLSTYYPFTKPRSTGHITRPTPAGKNAKVNKDHANYRDSFCSRSVWIRSLCCYSGFSCLGLRVCFCSCNIYNSLVLCKINSKTMRSRRKIKPLKSNCSDCSSRRCRFPLNQSQQLQYLHFFIGFLRIESGSSWLR